MGEVTNYNDYVDMANQEYNNTLTGATEDNFFTKISESGQRNQLARYYYNKTGLNISDTNRIVIAPKNGYMIQRLSYIDNDLIGGVKSGIQALDIDTSSAGEIALRNKGAVGQVKLVYVVHSLAYALGIKIDTSKVDIFPVLNEALHDFEFLYFAPLNIARSVTSENIDFIDVLFIAYAFRTYFDKVLLQSLANAMFNAGWFNRSINIISDLSNIPLNKWYNYGTLSTKYSFDLLKTCISKAYSEVPTSLTDYCDLRTDVVRATVQSIIRANIPDDFLDLNIPFYIKVDPYTTATQAGVTVGFCYAKNEQVNFTTQRADSLLQGYATPINISSIYPNKWTEVGVVCKKKIDSQGKITYDTYRSTTTQNNNVVFAGADVWANASYVYSNIGSVYEEVGVEGITIIDNAILPSGTDSLDTDYPDWVALLENWKSTGIDWVSEKLKNVFNIISFLPLNLITNGITYPEKEPGVPYEPIEVETYEVLLPEIIPPLPTNVVETLTLIPDEDDVVVDPNDPETYKPIIDPKHPEKYPPENPYYNTDIDYPKDYNDPIGDNPNNPTEPPSKNHGSISIPPKNPTDSVTSSRLFTVYNPTADQIDALGGYLWGESIAGTLASIFTNPLNAIISLHCIYCEPDVIGTREIRLGYLASGVSAKYVVSQYKEVDCGTIRIPEYYGDCRDYSPYTTINLYLPFIGFRPIKVDDVMGSELSIKYYVDVYTGACLACVSVNKGGVIQLTYNFDGNCSVMLPLTAGSWANMTVGLATALTSMIVNPVAGALQIPNAVHNGISMSSQGQMGSNVGAMGRKKPYVVVTNTQAYDAIGYNELYGYPANILTKLSQLEGYTKVKEVHVENVNNATVDEKNEIERLLKSGVIIS